MCQKLALEFMKGLWHVPYEAALQQLRLSSLTHQRTRDDLISIFKFSLLNFPILSIFTNPTRTGLRGHFNIPFRLVVYNCPYDLLHEPNFTLIDFVAGTESDVIALEEAICS